MKFIKPNASKDRASFPLRNKRKVKGEISFRCAIKLIFPSFNGFDS